MDVPLTNLRMESIETAGISRLLNMDPGQKHAGMTVFLSG
jgi:hypothetical protein